MNLYGSIVLERLELSEPSGFLLSGLGYREVFSFRRGSIDNTRDIEDYSGAVFTLGGDGDAAEDFRHETARECFLHQRVRGRGVRARQAQNYEAVSEVNLEILRFVVLVTHIYECGVAARSDGAADHDASAHVLFGQFHVDLVFGSAIEAEGFAFG